MQCLKEILASSRFDDIKECIRRTVFWVLTIAILPIVIPINLLVLFIFVHEKHRNNLFIICYDTLSLRWLLDLVGARKDAKTSKMMEHGWPGVEYFRDLPNVNFHLTYYGLLRPFTYISELSGYVPDMMRVDPDPTGFCALYTTRMMYIDGVVEKGAKNGDIEQLLVLGTGWDFRGLNTSIAFPNVTVIELDTPKMIEVKSACCRECGIKYEENVTTISLELNTKADLTELRSRIDMRKKTMIVLEGVSVFLNGEVNEAIIELLRDLPGGSELVADYWIKEPCSWMFWSQRYGKSVLRTMMRVIGEPAAFELPKIKDLDESVSLFVKHCASDEIEVVEATDIFVGALVKLRSK